MDQNKTKRGNTAKNIKHKLSNFARKDKTQKQRHISYSILYYSTTKIVLPLADLHFHSKIMFNQKLTSFTPIFALAEVSIKLQLLNCLARFKP